MSATNPEHTQSFSKKLNLPSFEKKEKITYIPLKCPRKSKDPRVITAYSIFEMYKKGEILLHKALRAGATTSLSSESMNRNELFLLIAPTKAISERTVAIDACIYTEKENPEIINIPPNSECILLQEEFEEFPLLEELPFLLLPLNCYECPHFEECSITELLRIPRCDGITITIDKLAALLISREYLQSQNDFEVQHKNIDILDRLSEAKNIIIDECHRLQNGKISSITALISKNGIESGFDFSPYDSLNSGDYKIVWKMIKNFKLLHQQPNFKNAVNDILKDAQDRGYYDKHLSLSVPNEHITASKLKQIISEIKMIVIAKENEKINLTIDEIRQLYDILNVTYSQKVHIHATRTGDEIHVMASAVNDLFVAVLQDFIKDLNIYENIRIIFTSGTICSYDYSKFLYRNIEPMKVLFGPNGDPMKSNNNMFIFPDNFKLSSKGKYSLKDKNTKRDIIDNIINILKMYGNDDCYIVAMNKKDSITIMDALKKEGHPHVVDYYNSTDTIGVSSNSRVMVSVGIAHKPVNTYDPMTDTTDDSKKLYWENVHCDTWQTWSRVKDPEGKVPSIVFAIGCTSEECNNITKWGFGRTTNVMETAPNKNTIDVNVDYECISKPNIINTKYFDETYIMAIHYKKTFEVFSQSVPNNLIGTNGHFSSKVFSKCSVVHEIFTEKNNNPIKNRDGKFAKKNKMITSELLNKHFQGQKTICAHTLSESNTVRWIYFDIKTERTMALMDSYLEISTIPHLVEQYDGKYRIWIFLKETSSIVAKNYGKEILNKLKNYHNFDNYGCEIYPKQTIRNSKGQGDIVELPFRNGSRILFNGEFINEYNYEMNIEIIEITENGEYKDVSQPGPIINDISVRN